MGQTMLLLFISYGSQARITLENDSTFEIFMKQTKKHKFSRKLSETARPREFNPLRLIFSDSYTKNVNGTWWNRDAVLKVLPRNASAHGLYSIQLTRKNTIVWKLIRQRQLFASVVPGCCRIFAKCSAARSAWRQRFTNQDRPIPNTNNTAHKKESFAHIPKTPWSNKQQQQ